MSLDLYAIYRKGCCPGKFQTQKMSVYVSAFKISKQKLYNHNFTTKILPVLDIKILGSKLADNEKVENSKYSKRLASVELIVLNKMTKKDVLNLHNVDCDKNIFFSTVFIECCSIEYTKDVSLFRFLSINLSLVQHKN